MSGCEKKLENKDKKARELVLQEKEILGSAAMDNVNEDTDIINPESESPYKGRYESSPGYTCKGVELCH